MPSGHRQRYAIAWLIIIVASLLPCTDTVKNRLRYKHKKDLIERNRKIVGSLFNTGGSENFIQDHEKSVINKKQSSVQDNIQSVMINRETGKRKSLLTISGPKLFQDQDSIFDSDSSNPHIRMKRIMNSYDSPLYKSSNRKKLVPLFIDRNHPSHRMNKRYSLVEENPADENEAEYLNTFEDNDVDVPDAYLNDEITNKRNNLEDVYPEVTDRPQPKQSFSVSSNVASSDSIRKKRYRDEEAAEKGEIDCEGEEYYDDDASEKFNNQKERKRENIGFDIVREDVKQKFDNEAPALSEKAENSKLDEIDKNLNLEDDIDTLYSKEQSIAKSSDIQASKKHGNKSKTKQKKKPSKKKPKSKKKKPSSGSKKSNSKSYKKPMKEKTKPKARGKKSSINSLQSKQLEAKVSHKKSASINDKVNGNVKMHRLEDKAAIMPEKTKKRVATAKNAVANNQADKCWREDLNSKEMGEEEAKDMSKNEVQSFVVKAIPHGRNVKELQIYEKKKSVSKKEASSNDKKAKVVDANNVKRGVSAVRDRSDAIMGEVKDLLGKLIAKIDNLHSLFTEIREARNDKAQREDED